MLIFGKQKGKRNHDKTLTINNIISKRETLYHKILPELKKVLGNFRQITIIRATKILTGDVKINTWVLKKVHHKRFKNCNFILINF